MAESEKSKRNPPKGGRKGGTIFPRIGLAKAIEYSNNVVRKTHSAAQPAETIYVGVFGSKGPEGQVRASALKQYGLMKGDAKAFVATDLAKEIHVATPDQKINLYRKAFLSAKTFNHIYTTYQGDLVSPARLNQAAATAKVHPDSLDDCTTIFIEGAITAELATRQGDDVQLIGSAEIGSGATVKPTEVEDEATGDEEEKHLDDSAGDTTVQL